jgi:pyroglutamyl-peptidase
MAKRPRLLVTGFGPFPRMPRNPSAAVARRVAAAPRWRVLGVEAEALVLPTAYAALDGALDPALKAGRFDAVVMVGVASRAKRIRVERRAVNRASVLFPDAAGRTPSRFAAPQEPPHRTTRAALAPALVALRRHGLTAVCSQDAGRYLCNAAYGRALAGSAPALFVHIPKPPRPVRRSPGRPRRSGWPDRLAAGLADMALGLLRQVRARQLR